MVSINRTIVAVELFCYWYFLSAGFQPLLGMISHFVGTVACVWSMYDGIKWHYKVKDGEGLAWAVIGALVFVGFSARWILGAA